MIADLKPYAENRGSGVPWPDLFEGPETINADIFAIEKEGKGLLNRLLERMTV